MLISDYNLVNKEMAAGKEIYSTDKKQSNDLLNYKGTFYGKKYEKYSCPVSGAHFEFGDICWRLKKTKEVRDAFDK